MSAIEHEQAAPPARVVTAPAAASCPPPGLAADVLALQRTAGNRAVAGLLSARRPTVAPAPDRRRLDRYESGEHVQFMATGGMVTIAGLSGIDERYLVAMGDYYRTPEALMGAKPQELKELMALIDRDEMARTGKPAKSPSEDEWQKWSERWRPKDDVYMELNKTNESHFAPRNKQRWQELHKRAVLEAQKSGHGSGNVSNLAKILNGFAAHYLTDAFSAGHMIDKVAVMKQARTSLDTGNNRADLASDLATGLLANAGIAARLATLDIKDGAVWGDWGPATQPRLASLLSSVMRFKKDQFLSVFARLAHDDLNTAISSGHGIWVQNKVGDRWQLSGDTTLAQSSKTLEVGRKAVKASQDNLGIAAGVQDVSFPASLVMPAISEAQMQRFFDNVWQYVPEPTTTSLAGEGTVTGADQVAGAVAKYTNTRNPDTVKAMVALSVDQFDTALAQLRDNKLVRDHQP